MYTAVACTPSLYSCYGVYSYLLLHGSQSGKTGGRRCKTPRSTAAVTVASRSVDRSRTGSDRAFFVWRRMLLEEQGRQDGRGWWQLVKLQQLLDILTKCHAALSRNLPPAMRGRERLAQYGHGGGFSMGEKQCYASTKPPLALG